MKVLVIGGGGREHALVWKIAQNEQVEQIYCAPGNAGIAEVAQCLDISAEDITGLLTFAYENKVDLTVVGPEAPLTEGIVDVFTNHGLKIFGPSKAAARLEGSKAFAKEIMERYQIPTARYAEFTDAGAAKEYIKKYDAPCVVKADGLAAGKGVIIAMTPAEALAAVANIMEDKAFGAAGDKIIVEEFLEGEEVSVLAFTDGDSVVPMISSQDHKRIFDNDQGPNTGGMGAYTPAPVYTEEVQAVVEQQVLTTVVRGLASEGIKYQGVIYAGMMITADGPKVLEFNCRFGDPETQPVLMRLGSDLVQIMLAVVEERLGSQEIKWYGGASVCVVMASGGYPGSYEKGKIISGLEDVDQAMVFHAGTRMREGDVVTDGGRVLGVTARGDSISSAIDKVYQQVSKLTFDGAQYRNDIGHKALVRPGK